MPFSPIDRPRTSVLARDGKGWSKTRVDLTRDGPRGLEPSTVPNSTWPWRKTKRQRRHSKHANRRRERKWKTVQPGQADLPLRPRTAYWSKLNKFTGPISAPAIRFKLNNLEPMGNISFPAMQAIPKVVTPNMEAILQGVARNVHQQRLDRINNLPVYLLPHQAGDLLGPSKVEKESELRTTQHRWNSKIERRGRWPADPRKRKPKVRSLVAARETKKRQDAFEEARRVKLESWQAKYDEAARQEELLRRETAIVRRVLGMT